MWITLWCEKGFHELLDCIHSNAMQKDFRMPPPTPFVRECVLWAFGSEFSRLKLKNVPHGETLEAEQTTPIM